jgi:hypothetical protein
MGRVWGLFILFLCTGVFSQTCQELLTSQQNSILKKAQQSSWYRVKVLSREIENSTQTVILLGESHVKNTTADQIGRDILNEFEVMGLEGVDIKKYWNGTFLKFCIRALHKAIKILSFGYLGKPSTIFTADTLQGKKIIKLEEHHQPAWNDQLLSLGVQSCAILAGTIAAEALLHCVVTLPESIQTGLNYLKLPLSAISTVGILLPFFTQTRDNAMAEGIQKYFEENKISPPLLVISGALHTAKILKILQKDFSFKEIEL